MNTGVTIEGNVELYRENNTYKDMAFNDIAKTMRIEAIDGSVDIDGVNPKLTIDLAKVKFVNWTEAVALNDIIKQTVQFKAHYSIADEQAININLLNTQASY